MTADRAALEALRARLEGAMEQSIRPEASWELISLLLTDMDADGVSAWLYEKGYPLRSLDAAVALAERVLPGWDWHAFTDMGACFGFVEHFPVDRWIRFQGETDYPSVPLALCVAIVKAKLA